MCTDYPLPGSLVIEMAVLLAAARARGGGGGGDGGEGFGFGHWRNRGKGVWGDEEGRGKGGSRFLKIMGRVKGIVNEEGDSSQGLRYKLCVYNIVKKTSAPSLGACHGYNRSPERWVDRLKISPTGDSNYPTTTIFHSVKPLWRRSSCGGGY